MAATVRARHSVPGVHQQFEPFAEAVLIEPFVAPRLRVGPQIEVEHRRQLLRCRRGDELSAGVESAVSNELMQGLGRKVRHDSREERRIEQARESIVGRNRCRGAPDRPSAQRRRADRPRYAPGVVRFPAATAHAFRHGPAMIPVSPSNKQS